MHIDQPPLQPLPFRLAGTLALRQPQQAHGFRFAVVEQRPVGVAVQQGAQPPPEACLAVLLQRQDRHIGRRPGLLHMLRVGAIAIAAADEASRRLLDAHPDFVRQDETAQLLVYRHTGFRAPAWFVTEAIGVPRGPLPLPDIDTRRTAATIVPGLEGAVRREFAPGATVTGFEERHGRVEITVSCPADGLLVIGSTFYPGWEGRVDGRPAALNLVNGGFMAIQVPAGTKRVELRYAPRWMVIAIGFSLAVWVLLHAVFFSGVLPAWVRRLAAGRTPGRPAGRDDRPVN